MLYTYSLYRPTKDGGPVERHDVTTSIREIGEKDVAAPCFVEVTNNMTRELSWLRDADDLLAQRTAEERHNAWKDRPPIQEMGKAANPAVLNLCATEPKHEWDPFDERETDIHVIGSKEELVSKDPINPQYYKEFLFGRQWIESRQERVIKRYGPHAWLAVLETMTYKYLDRCGGKDPESQELQKALWYMKFMTAFVKSGLKPVRVEEVDKILRE